MHFEQLKQLLLKKLNGSSAKELHQDLIFIVGNDAKKKYHWKTKWTEKFKVSCQKVRMSFPSIAPRSTVNSQINQKMPQGC